MLSTLKCILSLSENKCGTKFTKKTKKFITRLPFKTLEKILEILTGQEPLNITETTIYKKDLYNNSQLKFITNIKNVHKKDYNVTLQVSTKCIMFNTLSVKTVNSMIKNSKNRFIFIPLNYGCVLMKNGHQAIIVIDTKKNKSYLVDPNGSPEYFDNLFQENIASIIESMIEQYSKLFNLTYIKTHIWNPFLLVFNHDFRHIENNKVGIGHCVPLTLIIVHIMDKLDLTPDNVFQILGQLKDEELLKLIEEYSIFIYDLFN